MSLTQLLHVELGCEDFAGSRKFFTDVLGLEEVAWDEAGADGQAAYMRCWGDPQPFSFVLREGGPQLRRAAWAVQEREDLTRLGETLRRHGAEVGEVEEDRLGRTVLAFELPRGLHNLLVHDPGPIVDGAPSKLFNQPAPRRGVGAEPRRIDHLHLTVPDAEVAAAAFGAIGFVARETVSDPVAGSLYFMSPNTKIHDLAFRSSTSGQTEMHHVAVWFDSRDQLLRAVDIAADSGLGVEMGPGQHAPTQGFFAHVLDPSNHRVELYTAEYTVYTEPPWSPPAWSLEKVIEIERALRGNSMADLAEYAERRSNVNSWGLSRVPA